jgi:octaheme c-type cytochrome (tetrathionate reductase family)
MTMRKQRFIWIWGLLITSIIVGGTLLLLAVPNTNLADDPWSNVPVRTSHTDHTSLITGPLESGQQVTQLCLACHEDAAHELMATVHWTWQAPPVEVAWRDEPVSIGKSNAINNFCLGVQPNIEGCSRCHAGYGWTDNTFFKTASEENVDCLACHDQSGGYVKANGGLPAEGVDLVAAAQSVGSPTRVNCGGCHFNGGGGNGVKHGDLDESLYFPSENLDVHMGRFDFQCIDCHQTQDHNILGRSISVSVDNANQIQCSDCHNPEITHADDRITAHLDTVACQTCHVPEGALRDPTKMDWDWSQAGDPNRPENPHEYLRIKGEFVYESNFMPEYYWYNGTTERYLLGDTINLDGPTVLNQPLGGITDPTAVIFPFKIHTARQPYDEINNILLVPQTVGPEGYWTTFDWELALRNGSAVTGLPFSGEYGFAETVMFWPLTHMIQPAENALQCTACHGEGAARLDWNALGYAGDPMTWGSRALQEQQQ